MKQRRPSSPATRSVRHIMAVLVILVGQVGMAGAGVLHSNAGVVVAPHFESGGTDLHYSHNEADCFTCRIQHLGSAALFSDNKAAIPASGQLSIANTDIGKHAADWHAPQQSRAPPTIV